VGATLVAPLKVAADANEPERHHRKTGRLRHRGGHREVGCGKSGELVAAVCAVQIQHASKNLQVGVAVAEIRRKHQARQIEALIEVNEESRSRRRDPICDQVRRIGRTERSERIVVVVEGLQHNNIDAAGWNGGRQCVHEIDSASPAEYCWVEREDIGGRKKLIKFSPPTSCRPGVFKTFVPANGSVSKVKVVAYAVANLRVERLRAKQTRDVDLACFWIRRRRRGATSIRAVMFCPIATQVLCLVPGSAGQRRRENDPATGQKSESSHVRGTRARSVKQECLSKVILFGESALSRVLAEYSRHCHQQRNHQGKSSRLLFPGVNNQPSSSGRSIECRYRLGGLLKYYR